MLRKTDPSLHTEELAELNDLANELMSSLIDTLEKGISLGVGVEDTINFIAGFTNDALKAVVGEYGTDDIPRELGAQIAWLGLTCRNSIAIMDHLGLQDKILTAIAKMDPDTDLSEVKIDMNSRGLTVKGIDDDDVDKLKEILDKEEREDEK